MLFEPVAQVYLGTSLTVDQLCLLPPPQFNSKVCPYSFYSGLLFYTVLTMSNSYKPSKTRPSSLPVSTRIQQNLAPEQVGFNIHTQP